MPFLNLLAGCIYCFLGFTVAGMGTYRVYANWAGWTVAQRVILVGVVLMAYAQLERGIELLGFHAHGPTIASVPAMIGMSMACYYFFLPTDPRIYHPEPWRESLKHQEPENYDKYIELLNKSAQVRNEIVTTHADKYKTEYRSE